MALSLVLTSLLLDAKPASAHGSAIDPPSRHYGCATRWVDWLDQRMKTEEPMCWQAYQAKPDAMWVWNGFIQDNVNNNHQARVPDGTLCSANIPGFDALNNPGPWRTVDKPTTFTWTMHDQARHGAAYIHIYVTRQGFDPLTQRLRWSDLELVKDTGPFPDSGWPTRPGDPLLNGVDYSFQVSAPGRTGRHIVYAVWRAGHADQNYYMCSDVRFPGGPADPTPTAGPTTPATTATTRPPTTATTRPPTSGTTATTRPPTAGPNDGCTASYAVVNQWPGAFQAGVTVTAGSAAIRGWTVTMTFPNGQTIGQYWNSVVATEGATALARNVSYNGDVAAGASTSFGIIASWQTTNNPPTLSCTAVR
jgi:chitin-binding protein